MTQQPSDSDFSESDFEDAAVPPAAKNSVPVILWVLGGLGCGCFSLIFLGIIAAIALPSFLGQANKAKQAEAKLNVGAMLRAQQAYLLEKGKFSPSIEDLNIGIKPETQNYRYKIVSQTGNKSVMISAQTKNSTLKSYSGAVFATKQGSTETTFTGICETDKPTTTPPSIKFTLTNGVGAVECPPGSTLISK